MKNSLHLEGAASEPIWLMADGEEPHVIGIRLDCGDAGVVYVTREQAADLAQQLSHLLNQLGGAQGSSVSATQEAPFFDCAWMSKGRQISEARGILAKADLLKGFAEAYHKFMAGRGSQAGTGAEEK